MKFKYIFITVFSAFVAMSCVAACADELPDKLMTEYENRTVVFSDMDDCQWANEYVNYLSLHNIISGKAVGIFDPFCKVTREEFIKMTVLASGIADKDAICTFEDINKSGWSYMYVASAQKAGLTDFYKSVNLNGAAPISRRDMAIIAYRALKYAGFEFNAPIGGSFKDDYALVGEAKEAVYALKSIGIIGGRDDGTFDPDGTAQRCESAKIICGLSGQIQNLYEKE